MLQRRAGALLMAVGIPIALVALSPRQAAAQYLDPGAGSLILQVVIAGVVGVAAVFKLYWRRIRSLGSRGDTGHDGR